MRPGDRELAQQLKNGLLSFDLENHPLPGIHDSATLDILLEQLLESIHRVKYVSVIRKRELSGRRADPNCELFDPLKAAILEQRQGRIDEAFWFVFLFIHFGKNARSGWRCAREVYGRLGGPGRWDWATTSADPSGFRDWLDDHQEKLRHQGVLRGFGNHRRRQSLGAYSANGTGAAVESYVGWVGPPRSHGELMEQACERANGDPKKAFDDLYRSMSAVVSFGRLARFDYLTMLGKLEFAPIAPGSTYLQGATGPLQGARLLFGASESATKLDRWLVELDAKINVGMQVLEDALCNWKKSPQHFIPFRG